MNDSTDMRNARIALDDLAGAVASELIDAEEFMDELEIHRMTMLLRDVASMLDDLMGEVLEYSERGDAS